MTELNSFNSELNAEDIDQEEEDIEQEDDVINTPFDPNLIRVDTRPMTIDLVLKRIQFDEIDLAPDFQRHAEIWTLTAQSRLIESILIRIPLPAFYMDATNEDKWLVIDGLQRLSALKKFAIDKVLQLSNLEFLTHLEGKNYDELPRNYQRRIDETVLTISLIERGTPPEVKYNIFRRINTGGISLSPQELRHALNPGKGKNRGKAAKFLDKLAKSNEFITVTNISKKRQQRMDDHEFVLGFIAFYLTSYKKYPIKKGRDYFLNEAMIEINNMNIEKLDIIENKFKFSMTLAYSIFGQYAFRKIIKNTTKRKPLNKSLFEAWSVILSKLTNQEAQLLKQRKNIVVDKFVKYIEKDKEFLQSISQAANKIDYRFNKIEEIIQEVLS